MLFSAPMSSDIAEKQRRIHPNSLLNLRPFEPGRSGNPGGVRKGTVFVSECYKMLMSLPLDQLQTFKPANAAEAAALRQVYTSIYGQDALSSLKEITDRLEGKAPQLVKREDVSQLERLIIRVQERHLAYTGNELSRDQAIEHIVAFKPELAGQLT